MKLYHSVVKEFSDTISVKYRIAVFVPKVYCTNSLHPHHSCFLYQMPLSVKNTMTKYVLKNIVLVIPEESMIMLSNCTTQ